MSQINTREVVLLASTTTTTSGTGPDIVLIQGWHSAIVSVAMTTTSGTLPTFDMYIQKKLGQPAATDLSGQMPTGTAIYDDIIHFTQLTTNGVRITQVCAGPQTPTANNTWTTTADWLQADAALTAASARLGALGGIWRVKYVVGGTTPSTVISVTAQLVPLGS